MNELDYSIGLFDGEGWQGKRPSDVVIDHDKRLALVRELRSHNGARQRYTVS